MTTNASNPTTNSSWKLRPWTLVVIVLLLSCVAFLWISFRLDRASENRARVQAVENKCKKAVSAIEDLGGSVSYGYGTDGRRPQTWLEKQFDDPGGADDPIGIVKVVCVNLWYTDVTDAELEQLKVLTHLWHLDLTHTNVTDAGLDHLKGLSNLKDLFLTGTKITDAGLECLKELKRLQWLNLVGTNITDSGLKHVKGLTQLSILWIDSPHVTDAGLKHLNGQTNLQFLDLRGTKVTDAGLKHLRGLTKLKFLFLEGTHVTDEGADKLKQALPHCDLRH